MRVFIDGKSFEITLETEQTIGDVLSGLELWLKGSGLELSGIEIDGAPLSSSGIAAVFSREIKGVGELSLSTSPVAQLSFEALIDASVFLDNYSKEQESAKNALMREWEQSPGASCLREKEGEIYSAIINHLEGKQSVDLAQIIEERGRELKNPCEEFLLLEKEVAYITERLERFALDIQTGKEKLALETVSDFAALCAKILRLIPLLRCSGIQFERLGINNEFFEEFNAALKEFFSAYESADTVLSGDLAEYEVAPRVKEFYNAIKTGIQKVLIQTETQELP